MEAALSLMKLLTVPEAGELLGVSKNTAYKMAHDGQLPVIWVGRKLRVPLAAFEEMLRTAKQPCDQAEPSDHEEAA